MKNIKHYVGYILIAFSVINLCSQWALLASDFTAQRSLFFSFAFFYISVPVILITLAFLIYIISKEKKNVKWFLYIFLAHTLIVLLIYYYYNIESNKVSITIRNLSSERLNDVNIVARNNQLFRLNTILPKDSISLKCDCRKITRSDSIGINLIIDTKNPSRRNISIIAPQEPIYINKLEVLYLNDTLILKNHDIEGSWIRLGKFSPLITTEKIKEYFNK